MFGSKKESLKDELLKKAHFLKQNDAGEAIFNFFQQMFKEKKVVIRKDNNANGIFLILVIINGFNVNFSVNLSNKDKEIKVDLTNLPKTNNPIRFYGIKFIREMYAEVAKVLESV